MIPTIEVEALLITSTGELLLVDTSSGAIAARIVGADGSGVTTTTSTGKTMLNTTALVEGLTFDGTNLLVKVNNQPTVDVNSLPNVTIDSIPNIILRDSSNPGHLLLITSTGSIHVNIDDLPNVDINSLPSIIIRDGIDSDKVLSITSTGQVHSRLYDSTGVGLTTTDSRLNVSAGQSGSWDINNISGTITLPTGASTSANQDATNIKLDTANTELDELNSSTGLVNTNLSSINDSVDLTNDKLDILNSSTGYTNTILATIDNSIKSQQPRNLYDKDGYGITSTALGSTKRGIDIINRDSRGLEYATTAFGLLKISNESVVGDYRFLDTDTVEGYFTETITGSGSWSLEGTALKLNTGAASSSKAQLDSITTHYYQVGRGMMLRFSAILSDTGVSGNVREWGYGDDNDGAFFRMNGTTLQVVIRKGGSEVYTKNSSEWDVPVIPDQYGHLYYIQIEWLGVGNIYFSYDGHIVHTYRFLGTSTGFSLDTPDLTVRLRNENTTNTTDVTLKIGGVSVLVEGGLLTSGRDYEGRMRSILTDNTGRIIVVTPPPQTPPDRTSINDIHYAASSGTTDRYVTIPTGKQIYIQRFKAGAEGTVTASVCELYYAPNGNTTGIEIIEPIFVNGNSNFIDTDYLSPSGNGTRAILMRIRNLTGGSIEIFAKWEGYY